MQIDVTRLKPLMQKAADRAGDSLSKLTKLDAKIDVVKVSQGRKNASFNDIPLESFVASVSLPVKGEVEGMTILTFPKKVAQKLVSIITNDHKQTTGFDEMEVSVLKEVGNILCGSFLTTLANELDIEIYEHLPIFIFDTLSTMLSQLDNYNNNNNNDYLLIEVYFTLDDEKVEGYVILCLAIKNITVLSRLLTS